MGARWDNAAPLHSRPGPRPEVQDPADLRCDCPSPGVRGLLLAAAVSTAIWLLLAACYLIAVQR